MRFAIATILLAVFTGTCAIRVRRSLNRAVRPMPPTKLLFDRDCSVEDCSGGQAWGFTVYYAFTHSALTKWSWSAQLLDVFQEAIYMVTSRIPCIEFKLLHANRTFERADFRGSSNVAPLEGVILVDSAGNPMECVTDGMGFPGVHSMRLISVGGICSQKAGIVAHELLHALGVNHVQSRMNGSTEYEGYGPHVRLKNVSRDGYTQYGPDRNAYIGSKAVGGYVPFDFESIMMYEAGQSFETLPDGRWDEVTGQRESLSEGDVTMLQDMYGCLESTGNVCPTSAVSRFVDKDDDCSCPSGSHCIQNGKAYCPSSRSNQSSDVFQATCETCKCVSPQCPRGKPDSRGDCSCNDETWCIHNGIRGCPSSRTSRDFQNFHSSCQDCKCIPRWCDRRSGAKFATPNDEGSCECPGGTECHSLHSGAPGCPTTNRGISIRYFSAACPHCKCVASRSHASCPRFATTSSPDSEGDCMCMAGKVCYNTKINTECQYSGGFSTSYFSAGCTNCECIDEHGRNRGEFIPYRSYYVKHESCNTKCGAKRAMIDPYLWDLSGAGLEENLCGECKVLPNTEHHGGDIATCQSFDLDPSFQVYGNHTRKMLCCRTRDCVLEEEECLKRGYVCEDHAACKHNNSAGKTICECNEGYEATPRSRKDGMKCSPIKPEGSRCCRLDERFMWVPKDHLHWKMMSLGKYVCPTIKGRKWTHEHNEELCEENRFVFNGVDTLS